MLLLDSWSLGVLIGLPLIIVFLIVLLLVIGFAFTMTDDGIGTKPLTLVIASVLTLITLVGSAWGYYPYSTSYHKWITIHGTVKQISSRFLGNDKSTTQRFVVQFVNGDIRSCDDTRCALVKAGDYLALSCKRHWQFAGTDGWDCNYIRSEKA